MSCEAVQSGHLALWFHRVVVATAQPPTGDAAPAYLPATQSFKPIDKTMFLGLAQFNETMKSVCFPVSLLARLSEIIKDDPGLINWAIK